MAQTYGERFGSSNYNWPSAPKNTLQAQAMAWTALSRARQNYLRATVRNFTVEADVLPEVNRIFDGLPKASDAGLLSNAAGAIQGYTSVFRDGGEIDVLKGAETALRGALAAGYYRDAANPPFYFYVDNAKVIILGSSRGPVNKTVNAGTEQYASIIADLKKNGKAVDKATAEASARGPSTPQSTEMPAAVTAPEQSFLDRLVSDPMGALKDAFSNPMVLGGTAIVGAGLVYWFFLRDTKAPTMANRRRRRRSKREDVEIEVEDEDVDDDVEDTDVDVEEEEEEEVEEAPRKPKKYGRKNRRGGGKR